MFTILGAALLAVAAGTGDGPPSVQQAKWLHRPNGADFQAAWPGEALRRGLNGGALIRCEVNVRGVLEGCKVLSEHPEGVGFGNAALALSKQFVLVPKMVDGKPVRGLITMPIDFETPGGGMGPGAVDSAPLISDPVWTQVPSPEDMAGAYPRASVGSGAVGHVVLRCELTKAGELSHCNVASESPLRKGFAGSARSLTRRFQLARPVDDKISLSGSYVDVPFEFTDPAASVGEVRHILNPRWVRVIDPDKVVALYPAAAVRAGVSSGRGTVDCVVDAAGGLTNCTAVKEEPPALDFGSAAAEAATVMILNPWTTEGLPAQGAHIRFPIRFNLHPDDPAPRPPAAK